MRGRGRVEPWSSAWLSAMFECNLKVGEQDGEGRGEFKGVTGRKEEKGRTMIECNG